MPVELGLLKADGVLVLLQDLRRRILVVTFNHDGVLLSRTVLRVPVDRRWQARAVARPHRGLRS